VLLDFEFIRIIFISLWPLFRVSNQKTKWKQNTLWFYYEYSFFLSFFPHRGKSEYFPIPFYDLVSLCATCRTTITKEKKKLREEKYWTSSGTNSFSFSFSFSIVKSHFLLQRRRLSLHMEEHKLFIRKQLVSH